MKSIVFLYAGENNSYALNKVFNKKSAFDLVLDWAFSLENVECVVVACNSESKKYIIDNKIQNIKVLETGKCTVKTLFYNITECIRESGADTVIYTKADRPFLNKDITKKLLDCHKKYLAEYTFADGYPYGLSPEILDKGTVNILGAMSADNPVTTSCIFDVIRQDINSFEIESVLAPVDYRYLRLDLSCSTKSGLMSSEGLFKALDKSLDEIDVNLLSDVASKTLDVNVTVPAFYNIQICRDYTSKAFFNPYGDTVRQNMSLDDFSKLVDMIGQYSGKAVISLSAWGEPLLHPEFENFVYTALKNENLSLLIETDGTLVDQGIIENISKKSDIDRITWIVYLDAHSQEMYNMIRENTGDFEKAKNSVSLLNKYFPNKVYPQFTRINENERELESFYRFYSDKSSPSSGNVIIQKYDSFCSMLPDRKPADLSPVNRYPCWHIKRDMTILSNGDVPMCRERLTDDIKGNVFTDGIEKIWAKLKNIASDQICGNYCNSCRNCDEYYTFNF